jgi:hypothetical protein
MGKRQLPVRLRAHLRNDYYRKHGQARLAHGTRNKNNSMQGASKLAHGTSCHPGNAYTP